MSTPIDARRLARAIYLDCRRMDSDRFLITGGSDNHVVWADGGLVYCDCFDFQRHGDRCKHCLCVLLHNGDHDAVLALRQLVREPARRPKVRAA